MYAKQYFGNPPAVDPQTCFVLMALAPEFGPVYEALVAAVEGPTVGFSSCKRADELFGGGHIIADILEGIGKSEIVIADVTNRNPNVFYELGIAHTVKDIRAVIIITRSVKDVPFDLSHLRCIEYEPSPAGLETLQQQIAESIRAAVPAGLRFAIQEGGSYSFPNRLPGPDRFLYDFDVGPAKLGVGFAKFRMVVRRYGVDGPGEVVSSDTYGLGTRQSVQIPFACWQLNLDHVTGERAHFCLCEPEST